MPTPADIQNEQLMHDLERTVSAAMQAAASVVPRNGSMRDALDRFTRAAEELRGKLPV